MNIDMIAGPSEVLGHCRRQVQPRLCSRRPLEPGGARQDGLRRPGHREPPVGPGSGPGAGAADPSAGAGGDRPGSIDNNGKIIVAPDLEQAIDVANRIAPEHLELCVDSPFDYLSQIQNAGSIFLGRWNPEPWGTTLPGQTTPCPPRALPGSTALCRWTTSSKKSQFSYYTRLALEKEYRQVSLFAKKEGLTAHARAVDIRFDEKEAGT